MKRGFLWILMIALLLTACGQSGGKPETDVDLQSVYGSLTDRMPEMMVLDETLQMNLLGVDSSDCRQVITAICADSMRVDEIWLLQARDSDALERLAALAQSRVDAQAEVCESYSPDQYAIVKKAEIITDGLYLALLIGPDAAQMAQTVAQAIR